MTGGALSLLPSAVGRMAAAGPIMLVMASSATSILGYAIILPLLPALLDSDSLGPSALGPALLPIGPVDHEVDRRAIVYSCFCDRQRDLPPTCPQGPVVYGSISSFGNLIALVASAWLGRHSDRHGRRATMVRALTASKSSPELLQLLRCPAPADKAGEQPTTGCRGCRRLQVLCAGLGFAGIACLTAKFYAAQSTAAGNPASQRPWAALAVVAVAVAGSVFRRVERNCSVGILQVPPCPSPAPAANTNLANIWRTRELARFLTRLASLQQALVGDLSGGDDALRTRQLGRVNMALSLGFTGAPVVLLPRPAARVRHFQQHILLSRRRGS